MKRILLITVLLLVSAPIAIAQDFCKSDFDYNGMVDANDVMTFLNEFGRTPYHNPCPPDGPSPVPKTGQTTSYATGDDGDLERGVELVTPRFTDNGDGTVLDNQTGLIWMKNADCYGQRTWNNALSDCSGLADGQCGLADVSNAGDWRLPNSNELASLVHKGYYDNAITNTTGTDKWSEGDPFNNLHSYTYWTSTTLAGAGQIAWCVDMNSGGTFINEKVTPSYVWCVRGGR